LQKPVIIFVKLNCTVISKYNFLVFKKLTDLARSICYGKGKRLLLSQHNTYIQHPTSDI